MDINTGSKRFGALAQETRLKAFRLLVREGNDGMAAGDLARSLEVPHNTMSSHLRVLADAGLIESQREGRSIIYRISFDGTRALLSFLLEDCCQGRPQACEQVLEDIMPACCQV